MTRTLVTFTLLFATVLPHVSNSYGQTSQGDPSSQPVNPVIQWNKVLLTIVRTPGAQPATIHPTRSFAIMHVAIYDAVNSIEGTHTPYSIRLPGVSPSASQDAAAPAAAYEVLVPHPISPLHNSHSGLRSLLLPCNGRTSSVLARPRT